MTIKYIRLPNSLVYPVTIDEVHVAPGQWVTKGVPIYTVFGSGGQLGRINAPLDGRIAGDLVPRHTVFDQPQPVVAIEPGVPPVAPAPDPTPAPAPQSGPQSPMFDLWRTDAPAQKVEPAPDDPAPATPPQSKEPQQTQTAPSPAAAPQSANAARPAPPPTRRETGSRGQDPVRQTSSRSAPAESKGGFIGFLLALLLLPVLAGAVYLLADARGLTYGGLPGGVAFGSAAILAAFVLLLGLPRGPSFGQTLFMSLLAGGVVAFLSQSPGLDLPGYGGFRATVPPEVEAPVAASLVRNLDAFRHPAPFGIRTGFVNDGEIFVTMQYAPGNELQRSIHVRDIDRIDARNWTLELYDYVSLTLRCKTPGCATTHRDEGNGDGIFFEPDHLLVRVYYRDNLHRVHSLIDDIARLAALYGNDELTIRKSSF